MKYRDESGKIVIDSSQADADIQKLKRAAQLLPTLTGTGVAILYQSEWMGDAFNAYAQKSDELFKDAQKAEQSIKEAITAIEKTVEKYKAIDKTVATNFLGMIGGALK